MHAGLHQMIALYNRLEVGEAAIAMRTEFPPHELDKFKWLGLRWLNDCGLADILFEADDTKPNTWIIRIRRRTAVTPPPIDTDSIWFSNLCEMWWPRHLSPSWSVETPEDRSERRRRAIMRWRAVMQSLRKHE